MLALFLCVIFFIGIYFLVKDTFKGELEDLFKDHEEYWDKISEIE